MFFDFSLGRVTRLSLVLMIIAMATLVFAYRNPGLNVDVLGEITENHVNRAKATASYWWAYKIFSGEGRKSAALAAQEFLGSAYEAVTGRTPAAFGASSSTPSRAHGTARSVPVLVYHGEGGEADETEEIILPNFIDQMRTLHANGWRTITLEEFYDYMRNGDPVPEKSFLLTFDDGRRSAYYPTDPLLQDLGYSAVMFVITGASLPDPAEEREHSTFYVSRTELHAMEDSGRWELQAHGNESHDWYSVNADETDQQHFLSNKLWQEDNGRLETNEEYRARIEKDMRSAKHLLEEEFGHPVISFAFPFSDYGQVGSNYEGARETILSVASSLYEMAFYQVTKADGDTFNYPDPSKFMMKRISPRAWWTGADLLHALSSGEAKDLPYTPLKDQSAAGWIGTWGVVNAERTLALQAGPNTTGAAAALNGGYLWKDYFFRAAVDWHAGSNVMLVARYQDTKNHVFCTFSSDRVALRQVSGGRAETLATASHRMKAPPPGEHHQLGVAVRGKAAGCYVDNALVVRGEIADPALSQGGVGVQIWDERVGVASVEISEISAEPL